MAAIVEFGSDTTQYQRGVEQVRAKTAGLSGVLNGQLKGAVAGVGAAMVAMISAQAVQGVLDYYGRIADLGLQLNLTNEEVQRLQAAAQLSGTSIEAVGKVFVGATSRVRDFLAGMKQIGDEEDSPKKVARALRELGISAEEFSKADLITQVTMVATGMEKMGDSTAANGAAVDLLGNKAKELLPLLAEGSQLAEKMASMDVISNEQVAQMEMLGDELEKVKNLFMTLGGRVILGVAGAFEVLAAGALVAFSAITAGFAKLPFLTKAFREEVQLLADSSWAAAENVASSAGRKFGIAEFAETPANFKKGGGQEDPAVAATRARESGLERIAAAEEKISFDRASNEEKLAALRTQYAAAEAAGREEDMVKTYEEMRKVENTISDSKLAFAKEIQSIEKEAAFSRLSIEEQIGELRRQYLEQVETNQLTEAAKTAKEISGLVQTATDKQVDSASKVAQAMNTVVAGATRRIGGGGYYASGGGVPAQQLSEARKTNEELKEIKRILSTEGTGGDSLGTFLP